VQGFLRCESVIPAEKMSAYPLTPGERCAQRYERHLREARGLASATITNYAPFIRSFLEDRFGDGPVTLSDLCAGDVVRFVQGQAPRLHPKCQTQSYLRIGQRYLRMTQNPL
jgi:integrase/recombinase XerD